MSRYPARIPKQLPPHVSRKRDGDCPQHRAFVRRQDCLAKLGSDMCGGQMHAHHLRTADNSGVGLKPHDRFCVPLCAWHHDFYHRYGQITFENTFRVSVFEEAEKLAARSPALRKVRQT